MDSLRLPTTPALPGSHGERSRVCPTRGYPDLQFVAALLTTELVFDAVRHAGLRHEDVALLIAANDDSVHVEVSDPVRLLPASAHAFPPRPAARARPAPDGRPRRPLGLPVLPDRLLPLVRPRPRPRPPPLARPRADSPPLEIAARERRHRQDADNDQVAGRPQADAPAAVVRPSERAQAQQEAGEACRAGRDLLQGVLVQRLERERPRRRAPSASRLRAERVPIGPSRPETRPAPKSMKMAIPFAIATRKTEPSSESAATMRPRLPGAARARRCRPATSRPRAGDRRRTTV